MGADRAIDSAHEDAVAAVKAETGGHGADVVLEMSGHPDGVRQAFKMLRRGGRISLLGIPSQPVTLRYFKGMALKIEVLEGPCRRVQGWHGQGVRAASLDLVVDQPLVLRPVLGPSCEPAGTAARPQGS